MSYPTKSEAARAICLPRWESWPQSKRDPCDGCALYAPCVKASPTAPGIGPFVRWIDGINAAAERTAA